MSGGDRPRVVLMPGNDVLIDARVLKNLATAARFGLDAIAIGVVRGGPGREVRVGDARVVIVPVPSRVGAAGARAWLRRVGCVLLPWYGSESQVKTARARLAYQVREAHAAEGRRRRDAGRDPLLEDAGRRATRRPPSRSRVLLGKVVVRLRALPIERRQARQMAVNETTQRARDREIARLRRWPTRVRWRNELPVVVDDDIVLGRLLDELQPDLVHVHDVFMMGVAARAAGRAALAGRRMVLVYDAREYLPGLAYLPPRRVAAYCDLEREFIGDFDRVVAVSAPLADLLRRDHGLRRAPDLVLNAPTVEPLATPPSVRAAAGVPDGVPLLVYAGGVNPARGVQTAVEALALLPGVHLVVVINTESSVTVRLAALAADRGVADRYHTAPFVPPEHVTQYFASADVGLSPLLHVVNHDVALTNKFCEYLLAGIPVVTSDTPAQADLVRELGVGEVFRAGDAEDLARAVRCVLDAPEGYRAAVARPEVQHRFSWPAQAEVLREVYAELLGGLPEAAWAPDATDVRRVSPVGEEP